MASASRARRWAASSAVTTCRSKDPSRAGEQDRLGVGAAHEAWFEGKPDVDRD